MDNRYREPIYDSPESYYLNQGGMENASRVGRGESSRKPKRNQSKSRENVDRHEMRGYSQQPKSRDDIPLALLSRKLLKNPKNSAISEASGYTFLPLCAAHSQISKRPSTKVID